MSINPVQGCGMLVSPVVLEDHHNTSEELNMNKPIQIDINLNKIPESAGIIEYDKGKAFLKSINIDELKKWVFDKIDNVDLDITFLISGPMPNCVGIQLGIWLGPIGNVKYKSPTGFVLEMDVV